MKEYLVRSGSMLAVIQAGTEIQAAKKAIKEKNPKSLGFLIEVAEITEECRTYMATENIVKVKK